MKDHNITVVQFKKFHDGDIIALFPNEKYAPVLVWDSNGCITSYMHMGQHGGASTKLYSQLDDAQPHEYMELKKELETIGYNFKEVSE